MAHHALLLRRRVRQRHAELCSKEVRIVAEPMRARRCRQDRALDRARRDQLATSTVPGGGTDKAGLAHRDTIHTRHELRVVRRIDLAGGAAETTAPTLAPHPGRSAERIDAQPGIVCYHVETAAKGVEVARLGQRVLLEGVVCLDR